MPSPCACTAFKMPSLIDSVGACWPPRARLRPPAAGAVLARRPLFRFSVTSAVPPNRVRIRSAIFQLIELVAQFCPFAIELREPLGNPLLLLPNLVQCRHLLGPSSPPQHRL